MTVVMGKLVFVPSPRNQIAASSYAMAASFWLSYVPRLIFFPRCSIPAFHLLRLRDTPVYGLVCSPIADDDDDDDDDEEEEEGADVATTATTTTSSFSPGKFTRALDPRCLRAAASYAFAAPLSVSWVPAHARGGGGVREGWQETVSKK
jgi:hypothetical protein